MAFVAQPPDLRRFPLVARASRSHARSPWSAAPRIRFLFVGSRLRYPASFSADLTADALRFTSVPATRSRRDFHPLTTAHAGRTLPKAAPVDERGSGKLSLRVAQGNGMQDEGQEDQAASPLIDAM